jgi:lipopolysaccharide transport system permease protein
LNACPARSDLQGKTEQMTWLKEIYNYRYFILTSIITEYRSRFIRSSLGAAWMILHPLAQVAIFAFILSEVLSAKLPGIDNKHAYAIYLMAGTLGWELFSMIFSRCLTVFIDNSNIMKKILFPKIALPIIVIGYSLINNILLSICIICIFWILGHSLSIVLIWLPVIMAVTIAFAAGLGLFFGIINVFVRDVGQVMPIILQFWFWLTPIVYMITILPKGLGRFIVYNPMYPIITAYHDILVSHKSPALAPLGIVGGLSLLLLGMALIVYRRASADMVDVL